MNPKIDNRGNKRWFNESGFLHRIEGPAVEMSDGTKCWYINGKLHRKDGPARIESNGNKEWWINGECHREDGPARIESNGNKEWWIHGRPHRIEGPAIERDGNFSWYFRGSEMKCNTQEEFQVLISQTVQPHVLMTYTRENEKGELGFHRKDGPAVEFTNGEKHWYYNGERINCRTQEEFEKKTIKLRLFLK
jgi:hypothetical protein